MFRRDFIKKLLWWPTIFFSFSFFTIKTAKAAEPKRREELEPPNEKGGKMEQLLTNNKAWADTIKKDSPDFFKNLSKGQSPPYLWIGCSDSRVPATQVCGLKPGDIFVHRNIANLVIPTDTSFMSVLQYAVLVLKVRHIIVCGHTGCGGVKAALEQNTSGPIGEWLENVEEVYEKHQNLLDRDIQNFEEKVNRLVELNIHEQVSRLKENPIVQEAWEQGQDLEIHGLVYDLKTGELENLNISV